MERLMAAFDIARSIGSVVGLLILLDAELPLAFGVDRDDDRLADGADEHREGSGDDRQRDAHVSYQHGAWS
jgi:hypothetical protein